MHKTFDHLIAGTVNSLNVGRSSIFVCVKCRRIAAVANKNVQLFAACLFKALKGRKWQLGMLHNNTHVVVLINTHALSITRLCHQTVVGHIIVGCCLGKKSLLWVQARSYISLDQINCPLFTVTAFYRKSDWYPWE